MMIIPPDFHFLRPQWFYALIPCALVLLFRFRKKTGLQQLENICDPRLLQHLILDRPGASSTLPLVVLGLSWLIAVIALAGPAWEKQPQPVFRLKTGRVIVLDMSPSMMATDIKPSRLSRAIFKIKDMLDAGREGFTGLVAFSGEPFTVVPLTDDTATIKAMLPALSADIMPVSGDRAAPALDMAYRLLVQAGIKRGSIILVSDGISDMASTVNEIKKIRQKGIRVSVLGIGTEAGAPVPDPSGGFAKDSSGNTYMARLDDAGLGKLAEEGGGVYEKITTDDSDIRRILAENSNMPGTSSVRERKARVDKWQDEGVWLVLLLIPVCLAAFRRGMLLMLTVSTLYQFSVTGPAFAFGWDDLWMRKDQQAWSQYQQGKYDEAARLFDDPEYKAAALYKAGKYKEASKLLKGLDGARALYNRGNSLAREGRLEEALDAYEQALKLDPDNSDARFNRDLVKKILEDQKKQRQAPQSKKSSGSSNDKGRKQQQGGKESDKEGSQENKGEKQDSQGMQNRDSQAGNSASQRLNEKSNEPSDNNADTLHGEDHPENTVEKQSREDDRKSGQEKDSEKGQAAGKEQQNNTNDRKKQGAVSQKRQQEGEKETARALSGRDSEKEPEVQKSQEERELEQWLRQIPDDPSGLLRRKFYLEHQRRLRGLR